MASVRPFQFTGLPRRTRAQLALEESVSTFLSRRPYVPDFPPQLAGMLERYLKVPCKIMPPEVHSIARPDLPGLLPKVGCLLLIGAAPGEQKILVDLDMGVASFVIERLLGGSGDADRIQRPLTEIEEGVLSFLLLKVLTQLHDGIENGHELALTLDHFASKVDDVEQALDAENSFVMLGVRLGLGKLVGYVRIFLPGALVTQSFGHPVPQSGGSAEDYNYMRHTLQALGELPVLGRVEVATLDLGPEDIAGLELGDIIILENHQINKTPNGVVGSVFIKIGAGENGGVQAHILEDESEQTRLQIDQIVLQEKPQEEQMVDEAAAGAEPEGENLPETEGLLRDVAAPVVVELGRIRMNTAQVARLRQGQILRLPRGPNDPVDLVVNGKLFAKGELIEVDGELGVRLVQVVGAG